MVPTGSLGALVGPTDVDHCRFGGWLYPAAREAVIVPRTGGRNDPDRPRVRERDDDRHVHDAAVRAQRTVRRYATANGLDLMVTLTFATEPASRDQADHLARLFLRRLRRSHFGAAYPWVRVVEGDGQRHRFHVHLLMPQTPSSVLEPAWQIGRIDVRRLRTVEDQRRVAEYIGKAFEQPRNGQKRRYQVAPGFPPEVVAWRSGTPSECEMVLVGWMGREPDEVWRSETGSICTRLFWREDASDADPREFVDLEVVLYPASTTYSSPSQAAHPGNDA